MSFEILQVTSLTFPDHGLQVFGLRQQVQKAAQHDRSKCTWNSWRYIRAYSVYL